MKTSKMDVGKKNTGTYKVPKKALVIEKAVDATSSVEPEVVGFVKLVMVTGSNELAIDGIVKSVNSVEPVVDSIVKPDVDGIVKAPPVVTYAIASDRTVNQSVNVHIDPFVANLLAVSNQVCLPSIPEGVQKC